MFKYPEVLPSPYTPRRDHTQLPGSDLSPVTPKSTSAFTQSSPSAQLNQLRDAHAEELQAIITGHSQTIETLQRDCEERISVMEKQIETMSATYEEQLFQLQTHHTIVLSTRQTTHDEAISKLRKDAESMTAELNSSLASQDETHRLLKMKADQAAFELSRIRDETQTQRNNDAKQIADLLVAKQNLEEAINELEVSKVDWMKRNGELEQRYSRKITIPPPQGPPPNMPLPPTPSVIGLGATNGNGNHNQSRNMARERSSGHSEYSTDRRSTSDAFNNVHDLSAAVQLLPPHVGQMVQSVIVEKERMATEAEALRKQLETKLAIAGAAVSFIFSSLVLRERKMWLIHSGTPII